jgi:ligand-binding SRPBCC domain-containing protein
LDTARTYRIEREQWLARPIAAVFAFFGDATNLEAIMPEWLRFSVIIPAPIVMDAGTLIEYRLRWRRMPLRWTTFIEAWESPRRFVDSQVRGPYRLWHHTHTFSDLRRSRAKVRVGRMSAPETIGHLSHASENPRRSRLLQNHLGKVCCFWMDLNY